MLCFKLHNAALCLLGLSAWQTDSSLLTTNVNWITWKCCIKKFIFGIFGCSSGPIRLFVLKTIWVNLQSVHPYFLCLYSVWVCVYIFVMETTNILQVTVCNKGNLMGNSLIFSVMLIREFTQRLWCLCPWTYLELKRPWASWSNFRAGPAVSGVLDQMTSMDPFQLQLFYSIVGFMLYRYSWNSKGSNIPVFSSSSENFNIYSATWLNKEPLFTVGNDVSVFKTMWKQIVLMFIASFLNNWMWE